MAIADLYEETITLPRALRFPVELRPPEGFDAEKLETWPPVLCVEVAGEDDPEATLVEKATWYRAHGVPVVWVVLPATRELLIISDQATTRLGRSDTIGAHAALPGLSPSVAELFTQLDAPR